jgi:ABC-type uncharacterized transport system ATPase subunit
LKASNDTIKQNVLLELEDIHMSFGKVLALVGVNLKIRKGEIHSGYSKDFSESRSLRRYDGAR